MNSHRSRAFTGATLIVLGMLVANAAPADPMVGTLGDLRAAKIEGCKLVPVEQVRRALEKDLDIQTCAAPSASQTKFLNTVQRQLVGGYEHFGFTGTRVFAGPDETGNTLLIRIDEGRRYTMGKLRFEGVVNADVALLRQRLSKERPGEESPAEITLVAGTLLLPTWKTPEKPADPLWEPGEHARFDEEFIPAVRRQLTESLFVQGLCWADAEAQTVPNEDGTVDLLVTLVKEGPRAELDEFQINGSKINTPQGVQDFLGFRQGSVVNLKVLREARMKLWKSARFLKHDFHADFDRSHPGKMKLRLELVDHPAAPPLGESMDTSRPLVVPLLRMAEVAQKSMAGGSALVGTCEAEQVKAVFAIDSHRGFATRVQWDWAGLPGTRPSTQSATKPVGVSNMMPSSDQVDLVFSVHEMSVASRLSGRRYTIGNVQAPLGTILNLDCLPDASNEHTRVTMNLGAGSTTHFDPERPMEFRLTLAPVFFLNLIYPDKDVSKTDWKMETHKGVRTLSSDSITIHQDATTGDFLDLSGQNSSQRFTLRIETDGFKRLQTTLSEEKLQNVYDAKGPVSSMVGFALDYIRHWPGGPMSSRGGQLFGLVDRLVSPTVLAALDSLTLNQNGTDDEFATTPDASQFAANPLAIARLGLWLPDELFSYGTWPWTVAREAILLKTGGSPTVSDELKRLVGSARMGPLGCLVVAEALQSINPRLSSGVARIGLERLTMDDFSRDFHDLFEGKHAGQKVLANLLQSLADLSDQDTGRITSELPGAIADSVQFIHRLAHDNPGKPIVPLLSASKQQWWEQLHAPVEARLKQLRDEPIRDTNRK